jgi:hypothetical protein
MVGNRDGRHTLQHRQFHWTRIVGQAQIGHPVQIDIFKPKHHTAWAGIGHGDGFDIGDRKIRDSCIYGGHKRIRACAAINLIIPAQGHLAVVQGGC